MSAAGRGAERVPFDYYPTPAWCVHRLLDRHAEELTRMGPFWLEPSSGDGAIIRAVDARLIDPGGVLGPVPWCMWTSVELRQDAMDSETRDRVHHYEGADFRTWTPPPSPPFGLALGNPPFEHAEAFARRCIEVARGVVLLLRLGFLGSAERQPFLAAHPPALRVLPDRPSFDGEGTDSSCYAWFVWNVPGIEGVEVLDLTPDTVRAAHRPGTPAYDPRQLTLGEP